MSALVTLFRAQAKRAPDHPALHDGPSYGALDLWSDRLAGGLVQAGLIPGQAVALRMARSPRLIAMVLAVLKAGGVVFPLGVKLPPARIAVLLAEAQTAWVISDAALPALPPGDWQMLDNPAEAVAHLPLPDASRPGFIFHTSGTTGRPKAIRIGQRGILRVAHAPGYVDLSTASRVAFLANPAFDAFSFEIWGALLNGGTLVPFADDEILDLDGFAQKLVATRVTSAFLTTSLFNLMALEKPEALLGLDDVIFGGEMASPAVLHRLLSAHPLTVCRLTNAYGPTETTTFATTHRIHAALWSRPDHPEAVPIGTPLADTSVIIANEDQIAPDGTWGEILISGSGLAEGYLGRAAETAERFARFHGLPVYRSGDLGRWQNGVLECGGRLDLQIKLRGHRVEPAEIEAQLCRNPGVQHTAVIVHKSQLIAFVAGNATEQDLATALQSTLPEYMQPNRIIVMNRLPLNANAKLDRAALEALIPGDDPDTRSFLQMGGDSLKAAQLSLQLRRKGKVVSVADLLSPFPMAEVLANAPLAPAPQSNTPHIDTSRYPASAEQRQLWLVQAMQPASTAYSIPLRFDFDQMPERASLLRALAQIVQRHAALRAAFTEDGQTLWANIGATYGPDLPEISDADGFFDQPFDLAQGQLLRAATSGQRLLLNLHHIAVDGWSLNLLLADLAAALLGKPLVPAADYAPYATQQAAAFADPGYAARRAARKQHLLAKPWQGDETLYLPKPGSGRIRNFDLPARLLHEVQDLAQRRGETVFTVLIGAFALSLWRLTGDGRLSLGVPVGLRPDGFDTAVGMFVNTQICRFDAGPETSLTDWLAQAEAETAALRAQHDVAFDHILADQRAAGQHGRLFDAMFVLENTSYTLPGIAATFHPPRQVDPRFALTLFATITPLGLSCQVEHDLAHHDHGQAARMEWLFGDTLAQLVKGFDRLDDLNHKTAKDPLAAISAHAFRHPAAIAVQGPDGKLTYAQLLAQARGIAAMLHQHGIRPGDKVGLSLRPSCDMVAAVLGVMLARAAWVPLDPEYPAARLDFVVKDAGLSMVVGDGAAALPPEVRVVAPHGQGTPPEQATAPDQIAYVIYTSGSTGQPKGVSVHLGGLSNYLDHVQAEYLSQSDLVAGVVSTSLNFDATITSLLGPLMAGRRVDILALGDLAGLADRALGNQPLMFKLTPSHLVAILAYAGTRQSHAPHLLVVGGEQLPATLVRKVLAMLPMARLVNEYGPTETVVGCATAWADRAFVPEWGGTMLIGRALNGMELSIRLPDGTPAQIGTEGELLISGAAVTPGYLGRPDLTAQRFVTLPDGQRGYLSGDLALQMPSGDFACLGRIDDQIKLNGYRIEPGEVEAVLLSDARVQGAAVLVHAGQLRAFVVSTAPETALRQDLAALLSQSLPSHLQPGRIDMLETLPLTSNGKTDRAALHSLLARAPQNATASPPIYQPIAQALADAFAQVLGQPLDPDLHFFDAGAGSLALMQVHARIKPLAPELLLLDFFAHPTLNALAAYIGNTKAPANMQGQPADIETALADAFAQVLGQPLDPDLHFFDAGAGSLALMQVHARIKPLAPDLTLLDFFVHPTLNALIRHLGPITPMRRQAALPPTQLKSGRIAIIGMAADLPGAADLASLWQMIKTGQEAIVHGPPNRAGHVNAVSSMAEPLAFDPEHFGISARDAKLMDPQQRQLLMGAVKALDHAGIDVSRMPEIGLVLGSSENTYHHALLRNGGPEILDQGLALLHEKDFLATRIAHLLDLRGPALTVQTACSTSLVAVHQACQMLHAGAAQVALAGGAGIDLANLQGYQHRPGDIFSADGHCAPFSADASGTVPANGWGYVVLRPLEDALQAGDRIMAVIDGIAVNNDGAGKVGFTAPSVDGQARVIAAAMSAAGATVATLAYVEGHGTATALGDPIEVEALSRALGPAAAGSVALGSIKSQIGHLGAGAGVAGLIRAVLALWHQTLPPSLGFRAPSAAIDFARLPLAVQTRAAPWPKDRPFAGVSSFGMGGTNAHAVLSAAPDRPNALQTGPQTLLFSARSPTALQRRATEVAQALTAGADLAEMAAALLRAARCEPWRAAVTAQTGAKAAELLARITPRETVASPGLDLPDAADLADAWMRGLEPSRLPQPQARAAWDLPPYPFDTRICLHPAAAGPVATRLHFAEWFSTPVWHRVRVSAAPSLPTLSTNDLLAPGHEVVLTLALEDDAGPLLALLARDGLEMNRLGIRLTVRSDGAFGPEGVLAPDIAMLSGLLRVVAAELPCLHPRLIDAVRTADLPRSEHQGFSQQALRNGRLWHLAEASIAPPQTVLPDPGLYLITGGTGGIGNALAVRIAAQPGCHVTLLARTQPTLSLPKGVSFWALDIADDNEVAAFAANLAAKGERVQGIIHAAGTAGGSVTVRLTPARLAETLHAKRCGAQTLMRHLAPLTDGFILFCSSLSARQGIAGQADYATANAWLDAFAETRTETSPSVISVNWPAWRGIGMNETIRTKGGRLAALAQSLDAGAISADEGWQVFLAAITLGLPQLCVSPLDAATNSATPATPQPAQAATTLAQIFANALGRQTASPTDSFYELGGDSLQALDLIDMVARQGLGTLPASLLAGRLTLAEAEAALATPKATAQLHCLRQGGGVPLVLIHPIGGDIASYRDLVSAIAPNQPVYAIEDPALADAALPARGIPEMAQDYLGRLDKFAEVELLGWSFGGMVAQAMAAISPDKIRQLVLIDPPLPGADHPETAQGFVDEITHHKMLGALPDGATVTHPYLAGLMRAWRRNSAAMRIWQPHPVATPAVIWLALDQGACDERQAAWAALVPDTRFHRLKADHFSILRAPHVGQIAATLSLRQKSAAE